MALSRAHTFVSGETLTAALLNAEFDNILNNAATLISPLPSGLDLDGQILTIDADADSTLRASADDVVVFRLQGFDAFILDGDVATPVNGITFTSAATGTAPALTAHGETNVGIALAGKGTGSVSLGQATSASLTITTALITLASDQPIADSSGNEYIKFSKTASAVNEFTVANAATAGRPTLSASTPGSRPTPPRTPAKTGPRSTSAGPMVGQSITVAPGASMVAAPSSPNSGASPAAGSARTQRASAATGTRQPVSRNSSASASMSRTATCRSARASPATRSASIK
mgnify:CR=1 FL=1